MTAVMRAATKAGSGPRALRVGVVREGRMVDERLLQPRAPLTIGTTEAADVVVTGAGIESCQQLFDYRGGAYWLQLTPALQLKMAGAEELAAEGDGERRRVRLTGTSRGRVTAGNTAFLFQLVAPLPQRARRQLPASLQQSLVSEVDWFTTVVAAFSFLLHFFMVALVYSDWMDQVVDQDVAVAYLVESVRTLPPPPKLEQPREAASAAASAKSVDDKAAPKRERRAKAAKRSGKSAGGRDAGRATGDRTGAAGDSRAADLAGQLAQLELETLGALNTGGPSTKAVTGPSEVPSRLLDDAGRSAQGISLDGPDGLPIGKQPSPRPDDFRSPRQRLADVGDSRRTEEGDSTRQGVSKKVEGPKGSAIVTTLKPAGDAFPGAARAVSGMRPRFRRCYQRGLDDNPTLAGSVTLNVRIGPNGEVMSVSGGGGGGLGTIMPCLTGVVRGANFGPSSGGNGAMLSIPIRFVKR